ncbi:MAG: hypothetical protein OXC91_11130, partial [Rhodobacteraceae bacterium]|nr:hypothetical protein [Paracoccaceae bacterium]
KLSVDADRGDAISYREGQSFLEAWLQAREHHRQDQHLHPHPQAAWEISFSDVSATVEAALKLNGPAECLQVLRTWKPKRRIALEVGLTLPYRLIAEGRCKDVEAFLAGDYLEPLSSFFLSVPLALAGRKIDVQRLACGLEQLSRRRLRGKRLFNALDAFHGTGFSGAHVLESLLTACEILTIRRAAPELVDRLLAGFLDPELRRIDKLHPHESFKLDLLFRAYALREARAGRTPDVETVFEARPAPANEHDRPLKELSRSVFSLYVTVANALVNRRNDAELEADLRQAVGASERNRWRSSRERQADGLRRRAATSLLVLLAAGHTPAMVKSFATDVHGPWRDGSAALDKSFVARLSLWPSLHESLLDDIAAAAAKTQTMRIGAGNKSTALVRYAQLMRPLSEGDANEIFNTAVDVASELDHEVMAQIRLLDKLVDRGNGHFANARETARKLSNIVADAATRLEGYDHFPWKQAMTALARLDAPLGLANAARWDDEAIASRRETIGTVLKTGLSEKTITPEHAAALSMLIEDGGTVISEIMKQFDHDSHPNFSGLLEEAAHDVLMRHGHRSHQEVVHYIEQHGPAGPWSASLLRQESFVAALASEPATNEQPIPEPDTEADDLLRAHVWNQETLLDGSLLQEAVQSLWDRIKIECGHCRRSRIFDSARKAVLPADRVAHLGALVGLDGPADNVETVEAVLQAVDQWSNSPSVQAWCRTKLPEVI